MQRLRDCNMLPSKWYGTSSHPSQKAQRSLWKRKQKDCKTQRVGMAVVKWYLLDLTIQLYTRALESRDTRIMQSQTKIFSAWMEEGLMTPHTCLRSNYQLMVTKRRGFLCSNRWPQTHAERFPKLQQKAPFPSLDVCIK